jgi:hypothetical protein
MTPVGKTYRGVFSETGSNEAGVVIRGDEFTRLMAYNDRKWVVILNGCLVAIAGFGPFLFPSIS